MVSELARDLRKGWKPVGTVVECGSDGLPAKEGQVRIRNSAPEPEEGAGPPAKRRRPKEGTEGSGSDDDRQLVQSADRDTEWIDLDGPQRDSVIEGGGKIYDWAKEVAVLEDGGSGIPGLAYLPIDDGAEDPVSTEDEEEVVFYRMIKLKGQVLDPGESCYHAVARIDPAKTACNKHGIWTRDMTPVTDHSFGIGEICKSCIRFRPELKWRIEFDGELDREKGMREWIGDEGVAGSKTRRMLD